MNTELKGRLTGWIAFTELGMARVKLENPDLPKIDFALVATGEGGQGRVATQWEMGSFIADLKALVGYDEEAED